MGMLPKSNRELSRWTNIDLLDVNSDEDTEYLLSQKYFILDTNNVIWAKVGGSVMKATWTDGEFQWNEDDRLPDSEYHWRLYFIE
jgi:hypothetical protein